MLIVGWVKEEREEEKGQEEELCWSRHVIKHTIREYAFVSAPEGAAESHRGVTPSWTNLQMFSLRLVTKHCEGCNDESLSSAGGPLGTTVCFMNSP